MTATETTRGSIYDVELIRKDFPILQREVHGLPLVYLDNAATSQKPSSVIDTITGYYTQTNANVHRGLHVLAEEATEQYEKARDRVAQFVNAPSPECIVFTRGTTEAINLVASSWGRAHLSEGDEVILTGMEHHSNIVPWQLIAQETGAVLKFVPVLDDGTLDLEEYDRLLSKRTKLVAAVHKSNVLGTINPIAEMATKAHSVGARFLADGAQSCPHLDVDIQALHCDFYTLSGHKMCAPTGIGALVASHREVLELLPPYQGGGEMISRVKMDGSKWAAVPYKFEAGTPNIAGGIALAAAIDYLEGIGLEAIHQHEVELTRHAFAGLADMPWITVYGSQDPATRAGVITFNDEGVHPHDLGTLLDSRGVAVRAGHHCAQPLMDRLDVVATTRASFYLYNTIAEVDAFLDALRFSHDYFHGKNK